MALRWTSKQDRFIVEYLANDGNQTKAAIAAGYSPATAASIGNELMQRPEIISAIQEEMDRRAERTRITPDKVLKEWARLAFADASEFCEWTKDGKVVLKPSIELTPDQRACIAEVTNSPSQGLRIKFYDKTRALDALSRNLKLFNDKVELGDMVIRVTIDSDDDSLDGGDEDESAENN